MADLMSISRLSGAVRKYKHAILVLLIGLGLMLLPAGSRDHDTQQPLPEPQTAEDQSLEERLSQLLSRVSGAGEVEVLLTVRTGQELLFQTDTDHSGDEGSSRNNSTTVIVEDASGTEAGLVRRSDPPVYLGAVIACQGADQPAVKLAIVEAVACATGLGADQITVVKMK